MIVAGVTGGIGSGKTTVCRVFENLGAVVVYADDLAKELMVTDSEVIRQLKETFGQETYHRDGSLNKPHLIREAFRNERVDQLNAIVHPAVYSEFKRICDRERNAGTHVVVKEAALLLNKGRPDDLDVVILVLSNGDDQLKRVQERDGTDRQEIVARMKKQPEFENLQSLADYTILNDGSLGELKQKAKDLFAEISKLDGYGIE